MQYNAEVVKGKLMKKIEKSDWTTQLKDWHEKHVEVDFENYLLTISRSAKPSDQASAYNVNLSDIKSVSEIGGD